METAIRAALKSQYRAAFETVRDAIQRCPDGLWEQAGAMPAFWQIAYHAVFYGHFYMRAVRPRPCSQVRGGLCRSRRFGFGVGCQTDLPSLAYGCQ